MFTWLNKQGVRSDQGYEFQFIGRFDAEYRESQKILKLPIESGLAGGVSCIILDPSALHEWSDGVEISDADRVRILRNLSDAMDFQGLKLMIESGA